MTSHASPPLLRNTRQAAPSSPLIFSSEAEGWPAAVLNRFHLRMDGEAEYSYEGHMLAVPRSGLGQLTWRIDGRRGVAPVRGGLVSIQPARRFIHRCQMHAVVCDTLNLQPDFLAELLEDQSSPAGEELRALPAGEDPLLVHWMNLLVSCIPRRGEKGDKIAAEEIIARLGAHLLHSYSVRGVRMAKYQKGLTSWRLKRVFEHVEKHLEGPISLTSMAKAAGGMSLYHFCRLFRISTGLTPHAYVQRSRLEMARALLESRQSNLLEIALLTGFCDHSHLTRAFTRRFGLSPSEFRGRKKSKFVQTTPFKVG